MGTDRCLSFYDLFNVSKHMCHMWPKAFQQTPRNESQIHRGSKDRSFLQILAMEKDPLPESRGQVMQLVHALLQAPNVQHLLYGNEGCSLPREPPDAQHLMKCISSAL